MSVDAKRSYCIYEGPTAKAIVDVAKALGLPADTITQIDGRVNNEGQVVLLSMSDFEQERDSRLRMEKELEQARMYRNYKRLFRGGVSSCSGVCRQLIKKSSIRKEFFSWY